MATTPSWRTWQNTPSRARTIRWGPTTVFDIPPFIPNPSLMRSYEARKRKNVVIDRDRDAYRRLGPARVARITGIDTPRVRYYKNPLGQRMYNVAAPSSQYDGSKNNGGDTGLIKIFQTVSQTQKAPKRKNKKKITKKNQKKIRKKNHLR